MSWLAQLGHVTAKDLRQMRWTFGTYVVLVALLAIRAIVVPGDDRGRIGVGMFAVALFAGVLAVSLVQNDSPTRSNAFWASRPLYSSAVLGAKLAIALVLVIGLPAIGQITGLTAYGISNADAAGLAIYGAAVLGLWLLAAMVVGAVTEDMRSFLVVFTPLVLVLMVFFTEATRSPVDWEPVRDNPLQVAFAVLAPLSAIAMLAFLYRKRDVRRRVWIAAVAVVAVTVGAIAIPPSIAATPVWPVATPLRLEIGSSELIPANRALTLKITADGVPSTKQLTLAWDTVIVHLRDGSTMKVASPYSGQIFHTADLPTAAPVAVIGDRSGDFMTSRVYTIQMNGDERRRLEKGVASVDVQARVIATEPHLIADVPFERGSAIDRDDMHIRLVQAIRGDDYASADITASALSRPGPPRYSAFGSVNRSTYALVNDAAHQAMLLHRRNGAGTSGWILLPGSSIYSDSAHYEIDASRATIGTIPLSPNWFRDAHLIVVGWSAAGVYSARLHAEAP